MMRVAHRFATALASLLVASGFAVAQAPLELEDARLQVDPDVIKITMSRDLAEDAFRRDRFTVLVREHSSDPESPAEPETREIVRVVARGAGPEFTKASIYLVGGFHRGREYRVEYVTDDGTRIASKWLPFQTDAGGDGVPVLDLRFGPSLTLDVRSTDDDGIGVDFDLTLFDVPFRSDPRGVGFGTTLTSRGYVESDEGAGATASLDSVRSTWSLQYDHLLDDRGTLLVFDIHGRNESTQDFDTSTWTVGADASLNMPFLFPGPAGESWIDRLNFLDTAEERRPVSAPRIACGFDLVMEAEDSNRAMRTGDTSEEFSRLQFGAAWSIPVFSEAWIDLRWDGFLDLDADRNEFERLLEVSLVQPLTRVVEGKRTRTDLVIKYLDGALPPNFTPESAVVAGISVSF